MSKASCNYSASLGNFVHLLGSSNRSVGNYYLEKDRKGGFILGIDNHHRHITGINKGKGLSGSEADKANNRKINLDFYKAFCTFVEASKFKGSDSVRYVLARAKVELLQKKSAEGEKSASEGLDTPLVQRTVRGLLTALEDAVKNVRDGNFNKEHPLFQKSASEIFKAIEGQKCGWFGMGNNADYFLTISWEEEGLLFGKGGGKIGNVEGADQTNEADNRMIRSYLSAALKNLAGDILQDIKSSKAGLTKDALSDITAIFAKAQGLTKGNNITKALSVKEAKALSEYYNDMVEKYLPVNKTTRKTAYDGGQVGKCVESEMQALRPYEDELARITKLKVANEVPPPPPVVPPSPQFTSALKNVLGKAALTLNAEKAANALLSPLLNLLKAHTSAFVGGVEAKTTEDGRLTLKLTNIVAKDFLGKLVPELVSKDPESNTAEVAGKLAKVNFGDLEALSLSLVPKFVSEQVQGDESNPPRTRSVLRLTVPKTGAWRICRGAREQTSVSDMLAGVLDKVPEDKLKGPGYEIKKGAPADANLATVDIDISALKIDALAKLGLSASDLTSLKVGANGVQFGLCEPAGRRPANQQPGAVRLNAPHSLEAELGSADLLTNARTLYCEQMTKDQHDLAVGSKDWQKLENRKGLLNDLGALSLTTNPADETITVGANGMRLDSNLGRLKGAARDLVDLLKPRSLSVKLKPQMVAPGRLSVEIKDLSFTAAGNTAKAKFLSWAMKFEPLRKIGFWWFKKEITAKVEDSLGPSATIVMQDNGWPKVTLPVRQFTQGILGGSTDVGATLSEIKVTNRGIKLGVDVEHVVRNPIVSRTNSEEAALMANMRAILDKQQNAITLKDIQALQTGWNKIIGLKTKIENLIAAANRIRNSSKVKPISIADARTTLRQIEDDIKEFETKRAALGINGPWRQA